MKALRKMRPQRGAQLESVGIPTIGPTDVLVRVRAASICGTDLHIYGWDRWSASRIHPPLTFGHEFCGVVEKTGEEVTTVRAGDFVTAEMHVNCGHCRPCRMGQPHVCQNVKILGIDADGCFAEFVRIPERNIWKVDPAIPEHYAAIMDPLGNAVHTVLAGDRDMIAYMQRVAGYCLTGLTREDAIFFLYGSGNNGKSTFVKTLCWVLGLEDYAQVTPITTFAATGASVAL